MKSIIVIGIAAVLDICQCQAVHLASLISSMPILDEQASLYCGKYDESLPRMTFNIDKSLLRMAFYIKINA